MYHRSGKRWTDDEISILQLMLYQHRKLHRIAVAIGRTPRAIQHATRFLIAGQLAVHGPAAVNRFYGIDTVALLDTMVPPTFFNMVADKHLPDHRPPVWCVAFMFVCMATVAYGKFIVNMVEN
jgi:hypothetical protein